MTAYIIRRLILMIPTLLGISFLVFMLIALSPGGIGAGMGAQSGTQGTSSMVLYQAYLEDRYGLNDPVVVQYFRWLGRIIPIKFGVQDQIDPTGEIIRPPKPIKLPALAGSWYAIDAIPDPTPPIDAIDIGLTDDDKNSAYRRASNRYARDRASFLGARFEIERVVEEYAVAQDIRRAVDRKGDLRLGVLRRVGIDAGG